MARGADLGVVIDIEAVPIHSGVEALAKDGVRTGAAVRNWESYGAAIHTSPGLLDWRRDLLCDPQTSGGLLIAVSPDHADTVLKLAHDQGFYGAAIVGRFVDGPAEVRIA